MFTEALRQAPLRQERQDTPRLLQLHVKLGADSGERPAGRRRGGPAAQASREAVGRTCCPGLFPNQTSLAPLICPSASSLSSAPCP